MVGKDILEMFTYLLNPAEALCPKTALQYELHFKCYKSKNKQIINGWRWRLSSGTAVLIPGMDFEQSGGERWGGVGGPSNLGHVLPMSHLIGASGWEKM